MNRSNNECIHVLPGTKLSKPHKGNNLGHTQFKKMMESIMHQTATRPNLMFLVSMISKYMEHPIESHLMVAKRILRYLK